MTVELRVLRYDPERDAKPHEERYTSALVDGEVVVTREVLAAGDFGWSAIEARALDGRPARLI